MSTVEQHLVIIQEKEKVAKEQYEQLKTERLAEFPSIAAGLNVRLGVLDTLGVVPIITTFTHKPLEPIRIPGVPQSEPVNTRIRSDGGRPSLLDTRDYLKEIKQRGEEMAKNWQAAVLEPKLSEDLVWDANLRIQLYKWSYWPNDYNRVREWINLIYYPHNFLEVVANKGRIFGEHLYPISIDNLVLPDKALDRIAHGIAQGVNDPIRPEPKSYDHHFSPLI